MLMASHILQALELGGMPMHADGYLELAIWSTQELRRLDLHALQHLRHTVPPSLRGIVDNLLHERGEYAGAVGGAEGLLARCETRDLLRRLAPPRSR